MGSNPTQGTNFSLLFFSSFGVFIMYMYMYNLIPTWCIDAVQVICTCYLYMYTCTCTNVWPVLGVLVQYDLQWYSDGTLPSLPGGPKFPCPEAMLKCHALLDRLHLLQKMSHSSKVKLQAARYKICNLIYPNILLCTCTCTNFSFNFPTF